MKSWLSCKQTVDIAFPLCTVFSRLETEKLADQIPINGILLLLLRGGLDWSQPNVPTSRGNVLSHIWLAVLVESGVVMVVICWPGWQVCHPGDIFSRFPGCYKTLITHKNLEKMIYFYKLSGWADSWPSLSLCIFMLCKNCINCLGSQVGLISKLIVLKQFLLSFQKAGHCPIMCQEDSSSSWQNLQVFSSLALTIFSCLLSLLKPVIIWVAKPRSLLFNLSSLLDLLVSHLGN